MNFGAETFLVKVEGGVCILYRGTWDRRKLLKMTDRPLKVEHIWLKLENKEDRSVVCSKENLPGGEIMGEPQC